MLGYWIRWSCECREVSAGLAFEHTELILRRQLGGRRLDAGVGLESPYAEAVPAKNVIGAIPNR